MVDWEELVRREGPSVWRTIYRLVRNRADADECFGEVLLAALRTSQQQTVGAWPALLKRLAVARAVDRLRQQVRRRRHEGPADPAILLSGDPGPLEHAETAELALALREALAQLPPSGAEIFCLIELEGWSYRQVAEQFAMTTSNVGVMQHRTRQKLKGLLAGWQVHRTGLMKEVTDD